MASTIDWRTNRFHAWTVIQDSTEVGDFDSLEEAIAFCLNNEEILNGMDRDVGLINFFIPTEKLATSLTLLTYLNAKAMIRSEKYEVCTGNLTDSEKVLFSVDTELRFCKNVFAIHTGVKRTPRAREFYLDDGEVKRQPKYARQVEGDYPIMKLVTTQRS